MPAITDEILGAPEWRGADTAAEGYDPEAFKAALGVKASHADGAEPAPTTKMPPATPSP